MTREYREMVDCPNCRWPVRTDQPIKAWIRSHRELDSVRHCLCIGDSDLWIQRYGTRWSPSRRIDREVQYLMLAEIKTYRTKPWWLGADDLDDDERPQQDLLLIANQLLRTNWRRTSKPGQSGQFQPRHAPNYRTAWVWSAMNRRWVEVLCYGVHALSMSGSTPMDSEHIWWDGKKLESVQQAIELLRFDRNPDSLSPMEHRSRKKLHDVEPLFDLPRRVA